MTKRSTIEDPEMCIVEQLSLYNPRDFANLSKVGLGGFSLVYVAEYKNTGTKFAIKKFIKGSTAEINNEIKLTHKVGSHPNTIGFYGVTKFEDEKNYSLVLEYADSGTLGEYLRTNTARFKWKSQFKFAKEIAGAILWLHDYHKIIHRDLNSNNVLIHQNATKLADFGRSYLQGSNHRTKPYGVVPYMDPNIFENHTYDLTEKSDVYSLGVLLWELTSCSSPFDFENLDDFGKRNIMSDILEGKREKPIPSTNNKFVELYQKCWQPEPDERPDIHQVMSELNDISSENNVDNIDSESSNALANNSSSKGIEVLDDFSDCHLLEYN